MLGDDWQGGVGGGGGVGWVGWALLWHIRVLGGGSGGLRGSYFWEVLQWNATSCSSLVNPQSERNTTQRQKRWQQQHSTFTGMSVCQFGIWSLAIMTFHTIRQVRYINVILHVSVSYYYDILLLYYVWPRDPIQTQPWINWDQRLLYQTRCKFYLPGLALKLVLLQYCSLARPCYRSIYIYIYTYTQKYKNNEINNTMYGLNKRTNQLTKKPGQVGLNCAMKGVSVESSLTTDICHDKCW